MTAQHNLATLLGPFLASVRTGVYYGPCISNAPGRWTRIGPTWRTAHGWVTVGPVVADWGTRAGLGELAVSAEPNPRYHDVAAALVDSVYQLVPCIQGSKSLDAPRVKELAEEAEALMSEGAP